MVTGPIFTIYYTTASVYAGWQITSRPEMDFFFYAGSSHPSFCRNFGRFRLISRCVNQHLFTSVSPDTNLQIKSCDCCSWLFLREHRLKLTLNFPNNIYPIISVNFQLWECSTLKLFYVAFSISTSANRIYNNVQPNDKLMGFHWSFQRSFYWEFIRSYSPC